MLTFYEMIKISIKSFIFFSYFIDLQKHSSKFHHFYEDWKKDIPVGIKSFFYSKHFNSTAIQLLKYYSKK